METKKWEDASEAGPATMTRMRGGKLVGEVGWRAGPATMASRAMCVGKWKKEGCCRGRSGEMRVRRDLPQ